MESKITKQLHITLNDDEVKEIRNFMTDCRDIWKGGEIKEEYSDTAVGLFYRTLNSLR